MTLRSNKKLVPVAIGATVVIASGVAACSWFGSASAIQRVLGGALITVRHTSWRQEGNAGDAHPLLEVVLQNNSLSPARCVGVYSTCLRIESSIDELEIPALSNMKISLRTPERRTDGAVYVYVATCTGLESVTVVIPPIHE